MPSTPAKRPSTRPATAPQDGEARLRSQVNLSDRAYERIEELLICCELKPGRFLATHELQAMVGFGRTPVLQAVNRLAAETLLLVTPRHGVQIAPIDLTRERLLLDLRRDMERFVIRLATQRSGSSQRNQMMHIKRHLVEHGAGMRIDQFNVVDRRIDQLFLAAANEPFVESTLRPLHTIFRRIGWIYHMRTDRHADLQGTVDGHIRVIDAVASGDVDAAIQASDGLMDFVEGMFKVLEREVSPAVLDCSLDAYDASLFPAPAPAEDTHDTATS
ncbi:MAG: transcriptional regulator, GntR family [Rhodoferax sp.]|nr:transcriptional regulator, GntR family [Rhodoferax sp.]